MPSAVRISLATKLRWFDLGAAALSREFPKAPDLLGPETPPLYACPECAELESTNLYSVRLFSRAAVQNGALTAEHVPPKSFGGRQLVLTCKPCNNLAGSQLDAHARWRENPIDMLRGATEHARVQVTLGRCRVSAILKKRDDIPEIVLPPDSKNANNPIEVKAFRAALASGNVKSSDITITFSNDRHSPRRARVTWLRHAYLALFAVGGYHYIFQPGLAIVRKQIKEPDVEHIPRFLGVLPGEHLWSERRIISISEPEWLQSLAVQIGRYVAYLPKPGDADFYVRLAEERIVRQRKFTGEAIGWPIEPRFGIDPGVKQCENG